MNLLRTTVQWFVVCLIIAVVPGCDDKPSVPPPEPVTRLIEKVVIEYVEIEPLQPVPSQQGEVLLESLAPRLSLGDSSKDTAEFVDALGEPIELLELSNHVSETKELSVKGRLAMSDLRFGRMEVTSLKLNCPEYGKVNGSIFSLTRKPVRLPLVKNSSVAAKRAIRGVVLDPDEKPLPDVQITVTDGRGPGQVLFQPEDGFAAVTDSSGRFRYHVVQKPGDPPFPAAVKFNVLVQPPASSGLAAMIVSLDNDSDSTVRLARPVGRVTFEFQDAQGKQIDVINGLVQGQINYTVGRHPYPRISWHGAQLTQALTSGLNLPLGYVSASLSNLQGRNRIEFPPVPINEMSRHVVFKPAQAQVFRGKVIHAASGKPIAGALVGTLDSIGQDNLADITNEQWAALEQTDINGFATSEAIRPFLKCLSIGAPTRTNERGEFEFAASNSRSHTSVIAVARNTIPISARWNKSLLREGDAIELGAIALTDAATLTVETPPSKPPELPNIAIGPIWSDIQDPALAAKADREWEVAYVYYRFLYNGWLKPGKTQKFFIPANVPLSINFNISGVQDKWVARHAMSKPITLATGENAVIEPVILVAKVPVQIQVLRPDGKPAGNVPVRAGKTFGKSSGWGLASVTDDKGLVTMWAAPNEPARFGVLGHESNIKLHGTVEIQMTDQAPATPVELRLTNAPERPVKRPTTQPATR